MTHQATYLTRTVFFATYLAVGCTGTGTLGCGSSDNGPTVDSALLGVYAVDSYRGSGVDEAADCDVLDELSGAPSFLVLYSYLPNNSPEDPVPAGVFCSSVEDCQATAQEAPAPQIGYSFTRGNDATGWVGNAISSTGMSGDQCRADVQTHNLTASNSTINIVTDTVETTFAPMVEGSQATCANRDALASLTPDLPCKNRLVVDATRTADL